MSDWLTSSDVKTAAAKIVEGRGKFGGIIIAMDGTNAVTLDIYDNTTASGKKLIPPMVIPTSATVRSFTLLFPKALLFSNGIYVNASVAGGSFAYEVYWS